MNYEGASGLEFGGGNTKIDPSVAANYGEFESIAAIYNLLPDFAPEPIAWGAYETVPETSSSASSARFTARLAALHETGSSPNGKFGFYIATCAGNLSQYCGWEDSWEVFFSKSLKQALEHEIAVQGPDPEIDGPAPIIFETVIPRLLRLLETEGRSVKPSLVHGDLWYANTAADADTDASLVFACCFYAYNEYELGQWQPVCNRLGPEYVKTYHSYMQISPSEEDYERRVDPYKLRFNIHVSAVFPHNRNYRTQYDSD
ncbi:Fructosamine/Ketosamine-3-kinase [Corynascus novoguineensis]|uniref:protein-ribulosamine 3-kinase n=1 Tax=Corynascus novoguineensis TaxID=1126955 RepID=A0AAN7CYC5_9PEZI|nr:Fructosamine/Ketosamine-3-kinase [Corynascus novoguineensis]